MQVLDDYSVRDMIYHPAIHTNVRDFLSMEVTPMYWEIVMIAIAAATLKCLPGRVTMRQSQSISSWFLSGLSNKNIKIFNNMALFIYI